MAIKGMEKIVPISIGVAFILFLTTLLYLSPRPITKIVSYIDNITYDIMLRYEYVPIHQSNPIVIVDIDDISLSKEGRWPWSRKKLAKLLMNLFHQGAKVVALDIMFPEPEENLADEIIQDLKKSQGVGSSALFSELESVKASFNYDEIFAKSLSSGNSILGFVFKEEGLSTGVLPFPFFTLTPELERQLFIPNMKSYISNIPVLQKAAKAGAFINSAPDSDGVLRYCPLLMRHGAQVYASLALEAAISFMTNQETRLLIGKYGDQSVLEGIQVGNTTIPTDPWGRILIPFRGPPYSIPYISAVDVLNETAPKEMIKNRLVFIGSSATAMGDLVATSIAPVFAGVEVHAQIASGILDSYLPSRPAWGKGIATLTVFVLGLLCSFILPYLGAIISALLILILCVSLIAIDYIIWSHYEIVLPVTFPVFSLVALFILNEISGYLFETNRRKKMKSVFGQYVPPDCIDSMIKKGGDFGLEGETKELTVLFADIRNFTALSEGFTASELKSVLNAYLTPMTEIIFNQKGTIDKYVGDMIMAFWGAPLVDPDHALNGIKAAFQMLKNLEEINATFRNQNKPEIRIGVGINTGDMNVGDMGSKFRRAYTVLGDAVNLGSRLENLTKEYHVGIIVGEKTFEKTNQSFVYRKLDRVQVKGKEKGIDIYEPLCMTGECSQDILARLKIHNQAFEAYLQKKWDEAESLFKQLKDSDPNKELYDLYLNRISEYRTNPPGPDWDGTHIFAGK